MTKNIGKESTIKEVLKHKNIQRGIILCIFSFFVGAFVFYVGSLQEDIQSKITLASLGTISFILGYVYLVGLCVIYSIEIRFKILQTKLEELKI